MVPSKTAMHYLMHAHSIMPEEEIPTGAHYRARQDMLDNVRGYKSVKKGLERRITGIERERRHATLYEPTFISTSGVSNAYLRCPLFKRKIAIGFTEPRDEKTLGMMDARRRLKYL